MRGRLLTGARAGNFLQVVYDCSLATREDRSDLAHELAALHNEGLVDIVATFGDLKNNTPSCPDFFLTRHVFEQALPHLSAPVGPVMRCVLQLCHEAGQDLAAGSIFSGYIEFCAKDPERPREALKLIEADPDTLVEMLTATIAAGSQLDNSYYLTQLLSFIFHLDIKVRRHAVFAVGRIHWPKGASVPDSLIVVLNQVLETEMDDGLLGSAVKSTFAIFQHDKMLEEQCVTLIDTALTKGDEYTLHAASELLRLNTEDLPGSFLQLLFTHLKRVKPGNTGTLKNIDYGVAYLLTQNDPEEALRFLEELLVMHDGEFELEILDRVTNAIRKNTTLMGKVMTRWLLRGERVLCEAVHDIVGIAHTNDLVIEINAAELKPDDYIHFFFIARKAIGYLFMWPVTAASVVISLMRHAPDDETLDALKELLLDPLLLNYPGSMRDYVEKQMGHECGKVKETIEDALATIDQYQEALRAVPELPALYAGQSQRESYRRHMSEVMAESMKAAEKKSIFLNLFSRSTLLYGNKSIDYIHAGVNEPPHRMETPLISHGVSMELPRMDDIDPYGLNYMLRVFRLERFRT
ncbi:hypothetical protein DXT74_10560 [Chromobacterium sp. Rain0013]|nr:hypothetical protein DXT74_10560 [Chromobacterium sp. Rain0013]